MRLRRVRGVEAARGFTVLEAVVAMALLALGIALASSLVLRSQTASARLTAAFNNPQPRFAGVRLRRDLEARRVASTWRPGWRHEPLVLRAPAGRDVIWRVEGKTLRREQGGTASEEPIVQVVLQGVEGWRWRRPTPGLVDVEITLAARDVSGAVLLDVPSSLSGRSLTQLHSLRVAARSGPGW